MRNTCNPPASFIDNNRLSVNFIHNNRQLSDYWCKWKVLNKVPKNINELRETNHINEFNDYDFEQNVTYDPYIDCEINKTKNNFVFNYIILFTFKLVAVNKPDLYLIVWSKIDDKMYRVEFKNNDKLERTILIENKNISWYYKIEHLQRIDGPAVTYFDGTQKWYEKGKLHRENGPAVINSNGSKSWYKHGKLHREDGPAYISPDGNIEWYLNDKKINLDKILIKGILEESK